MGFDSQWSRVLGALVLVTVFADRGLAASFKRIRSEPGLLTMVVATASERSATFRSIAERVEGSDVIVHITCGHFQSLMLAGQTWLVSAGPEVRYLRVQVLCLQTDPELVAIVAHELQHVVEIASTASVVDAKSFARLFSTIGFSTCRSPGLEQFETLAAIATGERVRSEYLFYSDPGIKVSRRLP